MKKHNLDRNSIITNEQLLSMFNIETDNNFNNDLIKNKFDFGNKHSKKKKMISLKGAIAIIKDNRGVELKRIPRRFVTQYDLDTGRVVCCRGDFHELMFFKSPTNEQRKSNYRSLFDVEKEREEQEKINRLWNEAREKELLEQQEIEKNKILDPFDGEEPIIYVDSHINRVRRLVKSYNNCK